MGIFDFLKPKTNKPFVTENAFSSNKKMQVQLAPETLGQLRNLNVTAERELKLEFFFYTDTAEKAQALSVSLAALGYEVNHGKSAGSSREYLANGWTTKMPMADNTVAEWVNQMCELGYKHDCEFDGWGTTPNQE